MSQHASLTTFIVVTVVTIAATFLFPRFDIPPTYHNFADKRTFLGIPNFNDVGSNLTYLFAGIFGIAITLHRHHQFEDAREIAPWLLLFLGLALTTFCSGYYHWVPNDARLFWDRLPMTLGFMGLFAAVISERIDSRVGFGLLPLLIACGIGSLFYWRWSIEMGARDLRPYVVIQFYPLVAILLLLWLFPARYTRGYDYLIALAFYIAAKICESFDRQIFSVGHAVSGHTLKHILSGVGGYWLARMLTQREATGQSKTRAVASC